MRETMAERLKRQRDEHYAELQELRDELDGLQEKYMAEIRRNARLEAKLEMLAALLRQGAP
jgi:dynactin complex subunit